MAKINSYAALDPKSPLTPYEIERREVTPRDVHIEILYCGVCHSDLHTARGEWGNSVFPVVPGHEIVGKVIKVGSSVEHFKVGDLAAVGCLVDSCKKCPSCSDGMEQYCEGTGIVLTYNSPDEHMPGKQTYGGYSTHIVVDERFVLRPSPKLDLSAVGPLLCAGITVYSPLRHWKVGKGQKVGVVGLGGLGHMAVKFAHAFGAHTVLFTTSPDKIEDGKRLGADEVVISKNNAEMSKQANSFDFIINTVAAKLNLDDYTALLKRDGTMCLVGLPEHPHSMTQFGNLLFKRRSVSGSIIGGMPETQEMLDFCAKHNIVSDVEMIPIQKVNEAYERMLKSDVKYRFVIDMESLKS